MNSSSPIELALFVKYDHLSDGKCFPISSLNKNDLTCTHCQLLWILPSTDTTECRADRWYVYNQLPQTSTNQNQDNFELNYNWSYISGTYAGGTESRHINPCIPLLLFPSHWTVGIVATSPYMCLIDWQGRQDESGLSQEQLTKHDYSQKQQICISIRIKLGLHYIKFIGHFEDNY